MRIKRNSESGQALLLVLLAMATLATMVLSVVSRSVSEVSVTTREEESLRAFSAAEAGVEEALITGSQQEIIDSDTPIRIDKDLNVPSPGGGPDSEVSAFSANIERYPEDPTKFNYPFELTSGQAGSVWLVTRDGDSILNCIDGECFSGSSLTLCWGKQGVGGAQIPAIVANILYTDASGNYATKPIGFDPDVSRRNTNKFQAPGGSCQVAGTTYAYNANITVPSGAETPILMRVTTLYNTTTPQIFGVSTTSNLPIQGRKVSSEGAAGDSRRKIEAFLLNPEIPFIFDAAVYSGVGGLVK